jgi:hypothetical protein
MKSTQTILESLRVGAPFRPLMRHRCYRTFLEQLPPRYRDAIAFVYARNGKLHVALRHPGYKMELQYNRTVFRDVWNTLLAHEETCDLDPVDDAIFFVSNRTMTPSNTADPSTVPHYRERAEGAFALPAHSASLRMQFQRLRDTIRALRQRHD